MRLPLIALLFLLPSSALAQGLEDPRFQGSWHGVLETGGPQLRVELEVSETDVTLISLDQNNARIPATSVSVEGDRLTLEFSAVMAGYEGSLTDTDVVEGTFTQGGASLPLVLNRGATPEDAPF